LVTFAVPPQCSSATVTLERYGANIPEIDL